MAWREPFLRWFGPGMLGGVAFGDWLRLLNREKSEIRSTKLETNPKHE